MQLLFFTFDFSFYAITVKNIENVFFLVYYPNDDSLHVVLAVQQKYLTNLINFTYHRYFVFLCRFILAEHFFFFQTISQPF
jgi:hypothetical protein